LSRKTLNKIQKIALIFGGIILIIAAVLFIFYYKVNYSNKADVKAYLTKIVREGSNGLYTLSLGNYEIDPGIDGAHIKNIKLTINLEKFETLKKQKLLPPILFEAEIRELRISHLKTIKLLSSVKDIEIDSVQLIGANIKLYQYAQQKSEDKKLPPTKYLFDLIKPDINDIRIHKIMIRDGQLSFDPAGKMDNKKAFWKFDQLDLDLDEFVVDSTSSSDTSRLLYSKNLDLVVHQFKLQSPDDLYRFSMDKLSFSTQKNQTTLTNLKVIPLTNAAGFLAKKKKAAGILSLDLPEILIYNLNPTKLILANVIQADKVTTHSGNIKIFKDKTKGNPRINKDGRYFNQVFSSLTTPVMVDSILLRNMNLTYTEINTKTGRPGEIIFKDITGNISNITNIKERIDKNKWTTLHCTADFMNGSPLKALLAFDMSDPAGHFKVAADLGRLEGTQINSLLKNLALAETEQFHLKKLNYSGEGNTKQLRGSMNMIYNDLKVNLLKKDEDEKKIETKEFLSFLANFVKIIDQNPGSDGKERVISGLASERPQHKGFFALVWFNIFDCILEIAMKNGPPESIKENRIKNN